MDETSRSEKNGGGGGRNGVDQRKNKCSCKVLVGEIRSLDG